VPLERFLQVYEEVRLPRTAGFQASSREAGDIYEQLGEMKDIQDQQKRYELMDEKVATRLHWFWGFDVDVEIKNAMQLQNGAALKFATFD
jgi:hypothetical protein